MRGKASVRALAALLLAAAVVWPVQSQEARALFAAGRQAEGRESWLSAVESYRAALKENPAYLEPLVGLARCFFSLEEYDESLAYLREAQRLDKSSLELVVLEGRILLALGQLEGARSLFERVLSREMNNLEARFGLAQLDVAEGRTRNASQRYLESLRIRPENEKALLSLALLSRQEGDTSAAEAYLELALRYHSNDARVHYAAAQLAASDARGLERAGRYLQTALALDPGFRNARRLLAEVHLRQGQAAAAIEELRQLLEGGRGEALLWYALGLAYAQGGDTEQAVRSLSQALRLRPDDEIARLAVENLALERLAIGDPVRTQLAEYHVGRGAELRERNLFPRALVEYRRGLRLDPEGKSVRLQYAELLRVLGYPAKYMRELEVLRDLGFRDAVILDDIARIRSERYDSVAVRWSVDQFALDKSRYSLFVFREAGRGSEIHVSAQATAAAAFRDLLQRYEGLALREAPREADSFEGAFRTARQAAADYFLLLRFDESERSFSATGDLYLSATGRLVASWQVFRTGNDRVLEALSALAGRLSAALPLRGRLLARRFDEGVADLGRLDGLAAGEELAIVRGGSVRLAGSGLGLEVRDEDILGTWKTAGLDENVAEGSVKKRSFFDLINPGDELVRLPPGKGPAEGAPEAPAKTDPGLLRRLLRLVGL